MAAHDKQHWSNVRGSHRGCSSNLPETLRIPYSKRELVKEELDEMLAAGMIHPSTSPWASPIVLVPKKDGRVRFCVDYHMLDANATFDAYPGRSALCSDT